MKPTGFLPPVNVAFCCINELLQLMSDFALFPVSLSYDLQIGLLFLSLFPPVQLHQLVSRAPPSVGRGRLAVFLTQPERLWSVPTERGAVVRAHCVCD